ncbi:PKD domain-containing protein [Methanocalculus taiwanensis]|uniref:PKD domain-containing protein n=1 Tax=Methanocalculus taiwanensis TaxID=106207 RepID=A0ABD4TKU3_9EURY|nr:NosD domain-containing protein [Methanocalculus taiwanensis]MCQ1539532.1 PKD domain-containing protein [Methanocalculus taiwanensis]
MKLHYLAILVLLLFLLSTPASAMQDEEEKTKTLPNSEFGEEIPDIGYNAPQREEFTSVKQYGMEMQIESDSQVSTDPISRYTVEYVGANTAVITWQSWSNVKEYRIFRNGSYVVPFYPNETLKFIDVNLKRGVEYQYKIELWNTDLPEEQRYIGYYDGDPVVPGEVYGDLSAFGENDTWRGGGATLRFDTGGGRLYLEGSTLILKDIILNGEWDNENQRLTSILGASSQIGGAIQATGTSLYDVEIQAWNTGTAEHSFLDDIYSSNARIFLYGPNIIISNSYFTGNRSYNRLSLANDCEVTENQFVNISGGIEVNGDRISVSDNLFNSYEGPANYAGYAIVAGGSQGLISGNTISDFRSAIQISGSQNVTKNTIWNTTNRDATDLLRRNLKVIEGIEADGSVIKENWILDTDHPHTSKGIIDVTETGDIEITNNIIDGGGGQYGISASYPTGTTVIIRDNLITNMTRQDGTSGGVGILGSNTEGAVWIMDNTIHGIQGSEWINTWGVRIDQQDLVHVINNTISGFMYGIHTIASNQTYAAENSISSPDTGIYLEKSIRPYSFHGNFSGNSIQANKTGIHLDAIDTLIGGNTIHVTGTDVSQTHTGIIVRKGDQNLIQKNTLNNTAENSPVDIILEIPTAQLPGTLLLRENTIERGGNSTTFSICDFTEQIRISGVKTPPEPPRYPDYLVNKGDIHQWLSIRSNTFGNQENVQLNLTFHYNPEELEAINPESLSVWQYNNTRWHNGSAEYPWNGTRWLDNTTHEVGVEILTMPPWSAGTVIYAPLGNMPVHNLNLNRDYKTITEAFDDWEIGIGDTITVDSGYVGVENLRTPRSDIKLLAASGKQSDVKVIAKDPSKPALEVFFDNVKISGFILEGATSSYGLHFHGTKNSRIEKSTITGNGQGVCFEDYSGIGVPATTRNCTVAESTITGNTQGGFAILSTHQNTIRDSTISDPTFGIGVQEGIENTISGNSFTDCPDRAIWVLQGEGTVIDGNTIDGGETGILLERATATSLSNNNATKVQTAFKLDEAEDTTITGSYVSGYEIGFFLDEATGTAITDCQFTGAVPEKTTTGIRVQSSDQTTITECLVAETTSQNFGTTGVDLIGSSQQTRIIDSAITGIFRSQVTGIRVGAGAVGTWIGNFSADNLTAGQGGVQGVILAPGSGTTTIQRGTFHELRATGNITAISADRAQNTTIRRVNIDWINSTAGHSTGVALNGTSGAVIDNGTLTRLSGAAGTVAVTLTGVEQSAIGYLTVGDAHPVLCNLTVTGSLRVNGVESPPAPPEDMAAIGRFLAITNTTPSDAAIRIYYTPGDLNGVNPSSLRLWHHANDWSRVAGENGVDTVNRFVYGTTTDFSIFAPLEEPLRADFTGEPLRGVAPLKVQFTDLSEGGPTIWSWTFGDGGANATRHPLHTYQSPGEYTVSLRVEKDDTHSEMVKESYITVVEPVIANFTANRTAGFPPLRVAFNDTSKGDPTAWLWQFGDGNSSELRHPVHSYTVPGTYTVNLTAWNQDDQDSMNKTGFIEVYGPPSVSGITPTFGYRNGLSIQARISGDGFRDGALARLVGPGDGVIDGTALTVAGLNQITCTFNLTEALPGAWTVLVENADGKTGLLQGGFTIRPRGDFNGNARVDIGDVARVAWMAVGLTPDDPEARFGGGDTVTGADAARIAYYYVGKTQEI